MNEQFNFSRIISIDWAGAGREEERVDLGIAVWDSEDDKCRIELPPRTAARRWRRTECRQWLAAQLRNNELRTLVAMDFGFSLPWGADQAIFRVSGWREMIRKVNSLYTETRTAREFAHQINNEPHFDNHGPYRFDESRNDFRFYLDHGIGYYRLTELIAPQAISQWYLGSGGTVGFHTITGLAAIDYLLNLRERKKIDCVVWPFEDLTPDGHVLVESYPAIFPKLEDYGPCQGNHEKDAWRVLQHLVQANRRGELANWFTLPSVPFGRVEKIELKDQVRFEGHIFGLQ